MSFGDFLKKAVSSIGLDDILDIGGAAYSAHQGDKAADSVVNANNASNALLRDMYEKSYADEAPYRAAGTAALNRLSSVYQPYTSGAGTNLTPEEAKALDAVTAKLGYNPLERPNYNAFFESPDYQFRFNEGNRALDRSAASRGMLLSGAQQKATARYGSGIAANEFGNWFNRQAALADIGQTATNTSANLGQNFAVDTGNNMTNAADARGSSYINRGNLFNDAVSSVGARRSSDAYVNEMLRRYVL